MHMNVAYGEVRILLGKNIARSLKTVDVEDDTEEEESISEEEV